MHETEAGSGHQHLAIYLTDSLIAGVEASLGSPARLSRHGSGALIFPVTADIRALQRFCAPKGAGDSVYGVSDLYLAAALLCVFSVRSSGPSRFRTPTRATTAKC